MRHSLRRGRRQAVGGPSSIAHHARCAPSRPPRQDRIEGLRAEVLCAQEEAAREKERRMDGLESALRDSRATRAEADVLRGQLEEARTARGAADEKARVLGQQLATAEARLLALEQQAAQRPPTQVGPPGGCWAGSCALLPGQIGLMVRHGCSAGQGCVHCH
jgi:hypothetical protein